MSLPQGASLENRIQARYRHKDIARKIVWLGIPRRVALEEAGYSPSVVSYSMSALSTHLPTLYRAIQKELADYVKATENHQLTPQQSKCFVRDKLTRNVLEGSDKGVQSAKLLAEIDGYKAPDGSVDITIQSVPLAFRDLVLTQCSTKALPQDVDIESTLVATDSEQPTHE